MTAQEAKAYGLIDEVLEEPEENKKKKKEKTEKKK
jgi:ATP-dependent protease ClpP protease subunit